MADASTTRGGSHWSRLSALELEGALSGNDNDSPESEGEEEDQPFPSAEELRDPTDETARRLYERELKLQEALKRLKRRRSKLQARLVCYQKKEVEFVAQMDSHMDEVERTESALTQRIEQQTSENQQLRTFTEKHAANNQQLSDRLNETTKQCKESETRVQFLVDRIVALLSAGSVETEHTQAVVNLCQRERDILKVVGDARNSYDNVRQQNGELTSRLTEELDLSRRLSDQLREVEDRFFRHRDEATANGVLAGDASGGLSPSLPPRAASHLYGGLRGDQTEAGHARGPPDMPTNKGEESRCPSLSAVPETEMAMDLSPVHEAQRPDSLSDTGDLIENGEEDSYEMEYVAQVESDEDGGTPSHSTSTFIPAAASESPAPTQGIAPPPPPEARRGPSPGGSRVPSLEGVLFMEEKLRKALDRAYFECAVTREHTGVYSFGKDVRALVQLSADKEVIASTDGVHFEPIDDFIRVIALRNRRPDAGGLMSGGYGRGYPGQALGDGEGAPAPSASQDGGAASTPARLAPGHGGTGVNTASPRQRAPAPAVTSRTSSPTPQPWEESPASSGRGAPPAPARQMVSTAAGGSAGAMPQSQSTIVRKNPWPAHGAPQVRPGT